MWSLTSPHVKRISGSKNFRSSPQKDFCNKIRQQRPLAWELPWMGSPLELETADRHPAVDNEHVAHDVARLARSQPHSRSGKFAGVASSLGRDGRLGIGGECGILRAVRNNHWRFGETGSQRVNANVVCRVLHCCDASQSVHAVL